MRRSESPPLQSSRALRWAAAALLILALVLAYANSFPGAFFFDDDAAVLQNASIRHLRDLRAVLWPPVEAGIGGRPFANLTLAFNYASGAYRPWGYHATNLAIHLCAAVILFGLVRRTLLLPALRVRFGAAATGTAAIAALVWSLHPVHTNIVNYTSQRTEGLMAALYLLTLYAFCRAADPDRPGRRAFLAWCGLAFVSCLLGMATKEVMATAPLLVLLYDRTFISGSFRAALRRHRACHVALAATWLLLAGLMTTSKLSARGVGFELGPTAYSYALTESQAVVRYFGLAIWPAPLVFDNGPLFATSIADVWPSALVLLGLLATAGWAVWKEPFAGFCLAGFFILLAPSSSVIPVVQQPYAENRVYLPVACISTLGVMLAVRLAGRRSLVPLALAAVSLGVYTAARNPAFSSELAIWWDTFARRPENARAANNLGNVLLKQQRTAEAIPYLDRALALNDHYADAYNNRGVAYLNVGQYQQALVAFQQALANKEHFADAYYNLGETYLNMGRDAEALAALDESLALNPANAKGHNNRSVALLDLGRVDESIAASRRALELNPALPEAHYNLGNSLLRAGDLTGAVAAYDSALGVDPTFARAHNNAGVALLRLGKREEAAARFEAALRLKPDYTEAKNNLAVARTQP